MKAAGISEARWYDDALHRGQWYAAYNLGLSDYQQIQQKQTSTLPQDVGCDESGRLFRRECDKSRQKYAVERQWLVCEQRGAVQCSVCDCWFRSIGGLTVHHCGKQLNISSMHHSTTTIQLRRRPEPVVVVTALHKDHPAKEYCVQSVGGLVGLVI